MASVSKQIDTTFDIVTPENIAFEYKVAGLWQRLPAFAVDYIARIAIWIVLMIVVGLIGAFDFSGLINIIGGVFMLLLWFALEWFYGGLLETFWNGQTLGKRAMGLRVVTTAGEPINGLQAVLRNILRFADAMPLLPFVAFATAFNWSTMDMPTEDDPDFALVVLVMAFCPVPTYLIGLAVSAMNNQRQRLGDLVCGTMVISEEQSWMQGIARLNDRRIIELAMQFPRHMDVPRSTAKALAMYIERRQRFSPARRQEIAMHLGHALIERYNLPNVSDHDLLLGAIYYKVFISENLEAEHAAVVQPVAYAPQDPRLVASAPNIVTEPTWRR